MSDTNLYSRQSTFICLKTCLNRFVENVLPCINIPCLKNVLEMYFSFCSTLENNINQNMCLYFLLFLSLCVFLFYSRCPEDHHWSEHWWGHILAVCWFSASHPSNHSSPCHLHQRQAFPLSFSSAQPKHTYLFTVSASAQFEKEDGGGWSTKKITSKIKRRRHPTNRVEQQLETLASSSALSFTRKQQCWIHLTLFTHVS